MTSRIDTVITNARVVDGTGAPGYPGWVALAGDRIAAVAPADGGTAAPAADRTIDAGGLVLAPGFIDLHSHADFSVQAAPEAPTQLTQGVTTLLTGNCGTSPFPVGNLDALRAATGFLRPELDWQWTDAGGYAAAIDAARPALNIALQVGHGALRLAAMGDAERAPDAAELDRMCALLHEAADQGVHGFSTGLIYAPGSFADSREVQALAAVAADRGLLYSTHMRNETDQVLDAVAEAVDTASRTGVRLEISHIKAMGPRNHGKVKAALELMAEARAAGIDVTADVYPYTASSTTLTSRLPGWALDGGAPALLRRLADPAARTQIRDALADRFSGEIDAGGIVLASLPEGPYSRWLGSSLTDIAAELGGTPADVVVDVLARHRAAVAIINHAMDDEDLEAALRDPHVAVASDGWVLTETGAGTPHPRSFGTFPRVLGRYVRERGVLTLEDAVRKMTSLPAARAGFGDRGRLAAGLAADLVVFDPESVADRSTYDRPWQLSTGIRHVFVAGRQVLADAGPTGDRPGRILERTSR